MKEQDLEKRVALEEESRQLRVRLKELEEENAEKDLRNTPFKIRVGRQGRQQQ